jgi:signal transduction histidine kinase
MVYVPPTGQAQNLIPITREGAIVAGGSDAPYAERGFYPRQVRVSQFGASMKPRRRPLRIYPGKRKQKAARAGRAVFPVVAVGASAGGLEAVTQLLSSIPAKSGIAIVLVQHLAAKHESSLVTLLSRVSRMPVSEIGRATRVEVNHVYVIPPGRELIYARGSLRLKPRDQRHGLHMPADRLMESLATEASEGAIGVVLSSTGSDGLVRLERELARTRARMDDVIRAQESANEELQSANEEILSRNEELQSINEEMETAKEELQSSNEELTTLNEELEHRRSELSQLNSDLTNLFGSLDIPVLILGRDLRIRQFSPAAETLFSLMPSDIGRPVSDMRFSATILGLKSDGLAIIDPGGRSERQIPDVSGKPHSLRIHPYRVAEGKIDGAVVALVDISAPGHASDAIEDARQYAEAIVEAVQESFLVLDSDLRVVTANRSFYTTFQVTPKATVGILIYELGNGQWNIPELRELLEKVQCRNTTISNFEVEHDFPAIGRKSMMLQGRQFRSPKGGAPLILLSIQDETERRAAEVTAARSGVMSAHLMHVQDEERRRVARELHDSTAQSLAGLMMNMNSLSRMLHKSDPKILAMLAESRSLADESVREIRTISYLLHPPLLEDAGLASAMRWFADGFGTRSGIAVKLVLPTELPRLVGHLELALFRIAQEALTNVHHHSGSKSARVQISVTSSKIILAVSDRGKGLPSDVWKSDGGICKAAGVGIASMRERARQLGGTLEFNSSRRGTTLRAVLPLIKR